MVIAGGPLVILSRTARTGPDTTLFIDRLRLARNVTFCGLNINKIPVDPSAMKLLFCIIFLVLMINIH